MSDQTAEQSASSFPEVEVTQDDQLELWRRGIRGMEKQIEEQRPIVAAEREAAAQREAFGIVDVLYFRVVKLHVREGQPDRYRAVCISGMPDPSMSVWAVEDSPQNAVHEARFRYAEALTKAKVCKTWDDAKARAAKAQLLIADIVR